MIEQKKIIREYLKDKHCISAYDRKKKCSYLIMSELEDHEELFDLLFDQRLEVKLLALSDWQYYSSAKLDSIETYHINEDSFEEFREHLIKE